MMKISELSESVACPVQTIRYYEQQGLLRAPARNGSNYRVYTGADIPRLRFIRHCRNLDMTLEEIRLLLRLCDSPQDDCREVNALLHEHIVQVAQRIADLRALESNLKSLRRLCRTGARAKDCPILRELAGAGTENPRPRKKLRADKKSSHMTGAGRA